MGRHYSMAGLLWAAMCAAGIGWRVNAGLASAACLAAFVVSAVALGYVTRRQGQIVDAWQDGDAD